MTCLYLTYNVITTPYRLFSFLPFFYWMVLCNIKYQGICILSQCYLSAHYTGPSTFTIFIPSNAQWLLTCFTVPMEILESWIKDAHICLVTMQRNDWIYLSNFHSFWPGEKMPSAYQCNILPYTSEPLSSVQFLWHSTCRNLAHFLNCQHLPRHSHIPKAFDEHHAGSSGVMDLLQIFSP